MGAVQVWAAVEGIAAGRRELLMTRGRKVLELRPAVAWDKGRALLHLLRALSLHDASDVVPVYIGDDRTDEDAFQALHGRGVGILVSSIAKPTAATFSLRDPEQVLLFLLTAHDMMPHTSHYAFLGRFRCSLWSHPRKSWSVVHSMSRVHSCCGVCS
jgi:trehalose-6-phosphatase